MLNLREIFASHPFVVGIELTIYAIIVKSFLLPANRSSITMESSWDIHMCLHVCPYVCNCSLQDAMNFVLLHIGQHNAKAILRFRISWDTSSDCYGDDKLVIKEIMYCHGVAKSIYKYSRLTCMGIEVLRIGCPTRM